MHLRTLPAYVYRVTDSEFEGLWTPEEEYLDASLFRQYSRALYFSLVITYGNDLSECRRHQDFEVLKAASKSQGWRNRAQAVDPL